MPEPLLDRLDDVATALSGADGLVLALDFDGTLAPIAADPAAPDLPGERRALLEDLAAHPGVTVALVSGRALADLRERADVEGATYAGNHGVERLEDGERLVPADAPDRDAVAGAVDALRDRVADLDGVEVEDKGRTLTVHYRQADDDAAPVVDAAARDVAADVAGLDAHGGKQVVELRPPHVDKGSAVRAVVEDHPRGWLPAYVGDDVSDEAAFRALGDDALTVHVGDRADTAARYRLEAPADVERFLRWLRDESPLDPVEDASALDRTENS